MDVAFRAMETLKSFRVRFMASLSASRAFSDAHPSCRKLASVHSDLQQSSLTIIASQDQRTSIPRCRCVAYELCFGTVSADTHNCPLNSESHIILAISLVCTRQPCARELVLIDFCCRKLWNYCPYSCHLRYVG